MDAKTAISRAIELAGSEAKLGELIGFSQVAINKAKQRGKVSAEMAAAIDDALGGQVTKFSLRPDLWPLPGAPRPSRSARLRRNVRGAAA